ncbi:MAG: hypothetical protein OEM92_08100 [Gammaproteobacteria bacterium]|nr:hypothetical protein [Gammaproteobacteria bacterium]
MTRGECRSGCLSIPTNRRPRSFIASCVGGTIDLDIPFDPPTRFELTLNNLRRYVSGNGKNRSRKEEAKWQDTIVVHAEQGARGTRLAFRFDAPAGLDASDADQGDSYHVW